MIERILIYDPVPFKGGSKKVMKTIIAELPSDLTVWVISNDKKSWCDDINSKINVIPLYSPQWLQNKDTGILFFIKHIINTLSLFTIMLRLKRFCTIIGFSGPCVDFSLYILGEIIKIDIIQLIQGNISDSRVSIFGLKRAKKIFYLPSTFSSINKVLNKYNDKKNKLAMSLQPFINGINLSTIVTKNKVDKNKVIFLWAASLLKWKRLELFLEAITQLNTTSEDTNKFFANVCYIKPAFDAYTNVSTLNKYNNVYWYHDPKNLNDIRAKSSVFISTAKNEPFGLSILESMATGLAIVIPADNAYWDQQLTDGYNCLKYEPDNIKSLVVVLAKLVNNPELLANIAQQAQIYAQKYCGSSCYVEIINSIKG